jgi:hypothetical protein
LYCEGSVTFNEDSENRIPLFAIIPIGIPYNLANPVTIVLPYKGLNSCIMLPSTILAMI